MNELIIDLGKRSHSILLGNDTFNTIGEILCTRSVPQRVAIVTDKNIARLHLKQLSGTLCHHGFDVTEIIIPAGERQKSLPRAAAVTAELLAAQITRSDALIAFGGGVVGDVAGFVASTYRRGISFIQIPTTLLAQVESAIGGKNSVNMGGRKNVLGTFYQPKLIFSDVSLLSTLPHREIISGLGEVLKYGYLSEEMCSFLHQHIDHILAHDADVLQETIFRCNTMKAKMIEEDECELSSFGGRSVLNLGHTIGHALENLSHYKLRHGEAVLLGLRWELEIAKNANLIDTASAKNIESLLQKVQYQPRLDFLTTAKLLKAVFGNNKTVRCVLPRSIGSIAIEQIDKHLVQSALKNIKAGS